MAAKPTKAQAFDTGLADIFEEFRLRLKTKKILQRDYETHYNMGTLQRDDLLDEAVREFQTAVAWHGQRRYARF